MFCRLPPPHPAFSFFVLPFDLDPLHFAFIKAFIAEFPQVRFQQFSFWLVCDVNLGNSSGLFQELMRSFEIRRDQGKFVQMPPPSPTMLAS